MFVNKLTFCSQFARELNIDEMKTEWVRVCVRPEQSFTRAILEIYMADGGSLGEVIIALRRQKQFRIIQVRMVNIRL